MDSTKEFKPIEIIENINETLNEIDEAAVNNSFSALVKCMDECPLCISQSFYKLIKQKFLGFNKFEHDFKEMLHEENAKIFNLISKNDYYLDFQSEYDLNRLDYEIYSNSSDYNYKISVIIPIFNNDTLIHRTLMSIENQSFDFEDIEVLMIDDASNDETSKVIDSYVDKYSNFKAVHIKEGTGSAGTPRNIGLKLASAEYAIFMDHDDFLEVDALEKLYAAIKEYDCDFVFGTYVLINANNKPIKFTYPEINQGFFKNLDENKELINVPPSIWTKLFRKQFLLNNNILFPKILGEDAVFISKAFKHANGIYYLGEDIIYYYNLNENSYTSNNSYEYFVEGFTSEEYLFEFYSNWNHKEYYEMRGQGTLDYYLNRFMDSNLQKKEIINLFPLLFEFCQRFNELNIFPKSERNISVFNHIINRNVDELLELKNLKKNRVKSASIKVVNRINRHIFW